MKEKEHTFFSGKRFLAPLIFLLFFSSSEGVTLPGHEFCYDPIEKTGICLGWLSVGCTYTTPIQNIGWQEPSDVVIYYYNSSLDVISNCKIDGGTSNQNCDMQAAVDLSPLVSLLNNAVSYDLSSYDLSWNAGHTVSFTTLLSLSLGSSSLYVSYTDANGTSQVETLIPCADAPAENCVDYGYDQVFTDNFTNSGISLPKWDVIDLSGNTNWYVAGGLGSESSSGTGFWVHDLQEHEGLDRSSQTYALSALVHPADISNISSANNGVGFVFGYEDANNYYLLRWTDYGSDSSGSPDYKDLELLKVSGGDTTMLTQGLRANLPNPGPFTLKVTVNENGIAVCVDGYNLFNVTTERPILGLFGLYTEDNNNGVRYDNVALSGVFDVYVPPGAESPVNAADITPPTYDNRQIGTKLAGSPFTLFVAGLNDARDALQNFTVSSVKARIVPSASCPGGGDDGALTLWSNSLSLLGVNNPSTVSFTVNQAVRDARVQFEWTDVNGTARGCSYDAFSVRPPSLTVRAGTGTHRAGVTYSGDLNLSAVAGYDQSTEFMVSPAYVDSNDAPGTYVGTFGLQTMTFTGASAISPDINYSDVGRIQLSLVDNNWTMVDRIDGGCVVGSCSNSPGSIGCNVCGTADNNLSFIPFDFGIGFSTPPRLEDNASVAGFTYFSHDLNMSARLTDLNVTVIARNAQGGMTQNYDDRNSGGYEQNIVMTLDANFSNQNRIQNITSFDANFTDGFALVQLDALPFFFRKNDRTPQNPVRLWGNDVNLSIAVSDTNNVNGRGFRQGMDGNATFFYGRINPIDAGCIVNQDCNVSVFYEVYCRGCNRNTFGMAAWPESVNDVFWFINPNHPAAQRVSGSTTIYTLDIFSNGTQTLNYLGLGVGRQRVTMDHNASLQAPEFLYYHPYSDDNITTFYIDVAPGQAPQPPQQVITNEGRFTKSSSRIGE